ncbi:NRDE-2, necessary for RNA interference-domain-containing protein [Bisporella sp. PMI_857]|nr:NRDE-2, necessary for RNA interference-domain-containing protein [Bisporella sp. PMI_857]
MTESKPAVPKFASFKPKQLAPALALHEERKSRGHDDRQDRSNKKRRHEHRRHRSRSREEIRQPSLTIHEQPVILGNEIHDLFIVDRKGEPEILKYGLSYKYKVPDFHRVGAGRILGASSHIKIDRDHDTSASITLTTGQQTKLRAQKKYLNADFISLASGKGRERKRHKGVTPSSEESAGEDEKEDYRSIHGKSKSQPPDGFEYAIEDDVSESDAERSIHLEESLNQKSIRLSQRVNEFPQDVDAWLALIDHQGTLLQSGHLNQRITNAEIRSTADIKIHLYGKALEKCNSLQNRERLLVGMLKEGAKVWDLNMQADKWEQISRENIHSLILWKSYLDFKQTNFPTFRYEDIREVFVKRIKSLSGEVVSGKREVIGSLHRQLIYVLLRLTVYLRETGYLELSIAIWQALIEFNLFAPKVPINTIERIAMFKDFWESEVPRIGEDGALGWKNSTEHLDSLEQPEVLRDGIGDSLNIHNIFETWARSERSRNQASQRPARAMDEVTEDDPFRVILVSDIEEYLIAIPNSEGLHQHMLNAFLQFCGLPSAGPYTSSCQDWGSEQFIIGDSIGCDFPTLQHNQVSLLTELDRKQPDISSVLSTRITKFVVAHESMFGNSWFANGTSCKERWSEGNCPVSYKWIRNSFRQISQIYYHQDFMEYYLAFEWRNEPDTIKKVAKSVLKRHSSNLRLYAAYGMIEYSKGNKDIASGVFSAALDMISKTSRDERKDMIIIWKSWIWALLEEADNASALHLLLCIESGALNDTIKLSPATLLKTKQHLSSSRDHYLSAGEAACATTYVECLALLEYLTSQSRTEPQSSTQGDITSAISVFMSFSQGLASHQTGSTVSHELALQSAARLLYHHARIGPFRPAFFRRHLTNFLTLFPRNTIFLSLYVFNESRLRIENRDVWYRALRACPWAKELYIVGFENLSGIMEFAELKGTWKVMGEKDLRVHVDLEDMFEEIGEQEEAQKRKAPVRKLGFKG